MEWAVWEEQIVEFTSLERFPGDRTKKLVAENNSENIRIRRSKKKSQEDGHADIFLLKPYKKERV